MDDRWSKFSFGDVNVLMIGVGNFVSVGWNGYKFVGGDEEEDFVVDERRPSRIFFTLESLVPLEDDGDGQILLLFKLKDKRKTCIKTIVFCFWVSLPIRCCR